MTLEEIQSMWKVDSVIDQIDLDKASLNTPSLHAKYLEILNEKRLSLKSYEVKYKLLRVKQESPRKVKKLLIVELLAKLLLK